MNGSKAIKEVKDYETAGEDCDRIWSRNEFEPNGLVAARRVLRRFVRVAPVWNLHVGGRVIGTTREHPFYAEDKGWTAAALIAIGERILLKNNEWLRVDGFANSGQVKVVYNLEVEDDHTYFVGGDDWGFAVWAHNGCGEEEELGAGKWGIKEGDEVVESGEGKGETAAAGRAREWGEGEFPKSASESLPQLKGSQ